MPQLTPARCPNCGAEVQVQAGKDAMVCDYCGISSFVKWPDRPEPRQRPGRHTTVIDMGQALAQVAKVAQIRVVTPPRRAVPPPSGSKAIAIVGLVCALVLAGAVMAIVGSVGQIKSETEIVSAADEDDEVLIPKPKHPIKAADLEKVELSSLIAQANTFAKKQNKHAKLTDAHFTDVKNGTLDLTKDSEGYFAYEYRYQDSSKPPGQDIIEGDFDLKTVRGGGLEMWGSMGTSASDLSSGERRGFVYPLPVPKCTSPKLWKAAVQSGVPANSVSRVFYDVLRHGRRGQKGWEWSIRVDGHDEHRREIDAHTCKVNKSWAKKR